uniref:Bm9630 n=1 Tax=Brugia malayi TaxID=6279 RepID=A0A1I9G1L4_BRUMA|nr:Bm9630 [Brugia malayi]
MAFGRVALAHPCPGTYCFCLQYVRAPVCAAFLANKGAGN